MRLFTSGHEIDFDRILDLQILIHPLTSKMKVRVHFDDGTQLDLMAKADIAQIASVAIARLDAARTILGRAQQMVVRG